MTNGTYEKNTRFNHKVLSFLCGMLGHPFPRVRRFTAENLYVRLLEDYTVVPNQKEEESAMDFLLEARWDDDTYSMDETLELTDTLAALLGVSSNREMIRNKADQGNTKGAIRKKDAFESYESLVNDLRS